MLLQVLALLACQPANKQPVANYSSSGADAVTFASDSSHIPPLFELDTLSYPFIQLANNKISNTGGMEHFFHQLQELEAGRISQVRILHVGDSHVQADFWSGWVRTLLQRRFGSAGRGLIFPYKQAGTHSPLDFTSLSNTSWEGRWRTFNDGNLPTGISGMAVKTSQVNFELVFSQKNRYGFDNRFDCITLFYEKGQNAYDIIAEVPTPKLSAYGPVPVAVVKKGPVPPPWQTPASSVLTHRVRPGESFYTIAHKYGLGTEVLKRFNGQRNNLIKPGQTLKIPQHNKITAKKTPERPVPEPSTSGYKEVARFDGQNDDGSPFYSKVCFDESVSQLRLRGAKTRDEQRQATLYGVLLENSFQSGLLYSSAGVNGATFYHFNRSGSFLDQLPGVEADLVIVSLGTNESATSRFPTGQIEGEIDHFLQKIRAQLPQASILVTTNSDNLRGKTIENPNSLVMRNLLVTKAREYNAAWWDLHLIMGGLGSMRDWRNQGLARPDGVHFTESGYLLQAQLLNAALMNAYDAGH
jgi:LysM repeat protein/lysophospholipase L1-like esterase